MHLVGVNAIAGVTFGYFGAPIDRVSILEAVLNVGRLSQPNGKKHLALSFAFKLKMGKEGEEDYTTFKKLAKEKLTFLDSSGISL